MLAALGPRMLALAAQEASGSLSYLTLPGHTAAARAVLGPDRTLAVEQAVTLAPSDEVFRTRARTYLEMYTALPAYRTSWLRQGFDQADFVRGGSARLQDAMVVSGESAIEARVAEHLDAGADQVLLQIVGDVHRDVPVDDAARLAALLLPAEPVTVPRQGEALAALG
ncbi:MAG: hypothetical protein JWL64_884 [Frankiales bacterium]|nr:hypothetical protein [Frankiales bacterium]